MTVVKEQWSTRVTHLQISASHVLPVVFKSRVVIEQKPHNIVDEDKDKIGRGHAVAVPQTQVTVIQAMPLLKSWLVSHMVQVHAVQHANLKPGSLQTPDVVRSGPIRLTVWLQPTSASYVVGHDKYNNSALGNEQHRDESNGNNGNDQVGAIDLKFSLFKPTAQTLYVTAEKDE